MLTKENPVDLEALLKYLNYSEPRYPYTYHHDFIRRALPHSLPSRSDIAGICRDRKTPIENIRTWALAHIMEDMVFLGSLHVEMPGAVKDILLSIYRHALILRQEFIGSGFPELAAKG